MTVSMHNICGQPSKYLILYQKAIEYARAANKKRDGHPQYALGWSRREAAMHLKYAAAMRRELTRELAIVRFDRARELPAQAMRTPMPCPETVAVEAEAA